MLDWKKWSFINCTASNNNDIPSRMNLEDFTEFYFEFVKLYKIPLGDKVIVYFPKVVFDIFKKELGDGEFVNITFIVSDDNDDYLEPDASCFENDIYNALIINESNVDNSWRIRSTIL